MASTNKTTHYELSQYVSSDKPTYLVDYNGDMAKIDTGINTAKTTADTASTAATNAQTAAETAQTTANTAVTNAANAQTAANSANTSIGTLANLTTTEKTNLVGAINEVNAKDPIVDNTTGDEIDKAASVHAMKQYVGNKTGELKGTVLFKNNNGQTGSVTLNSSLANYDHIDIYYNGNLSCRVVEPNNKTENYLWFSYDPSTVILRVGTFSCAGTTITIGNATVINVGSGATGSGTDTKIYEVVGYKFS